MSDLPLHVFVFAAANYHELARYCAESIERYIDHPILTKNIVSNAPVEISGWRCILDHDFWQLIDPQDRDRNLYPINHTRQQIMKMSVDLYETGTFLVVDAEVLFLRPTIMGRADRQCLYGIPNFPSTPPHYAFTEKLCGITRQSDWGFVTDQMTYSSDTLTSIKSEIEKLHGGSWVSAFQMFINPATNRIDNEKYSISEFELIANYLLSIGADPEIRPINQYLTRMPDRQRHHIDDLLLMLSQKYDQDFISVNIDQYSYSRHTDNPWLTFYYSIKDPSWPDCWRERDFADLPQHVQKECQEVFGYRPPSTN